MTNAKVRERERERERELMLPIRAAKLLVASMCSFTKPVPIRDACFNPKLVAPVHDK